MSRAFPASKHDADPVTSSTQMTNITNDLAASSASPAANQKLPLFVRFNGSHRPSVSITELVKSRKPAQTSEASVLRGRPSLRSAARTAARGLFYVELKEKDGAEADGNLDEDSTLQEIHENPAPSIAAEQAPARKRKSRVLRRKTDHSIIERRRREKINERLIRLQDVVPACREEVFELLEKKPLKEGTPVAKAAAKMTPEQKQESMEKRCREEMVLEKLCIISHTVGECRSAGRRPLCAVASSGPIITHISLHAALPLQTTL